MKKRKDISVILFEGGEEQRTEKVSEIMIPDVWHAAQGIKNEHARELILEAWHMANNLLGALRNIEAGASLSKPIHCKPGR